MFTRACLYENGLERKARAGDGWLANPIITTNAASGNQNITIPMIAGGAGVFTGAAGGVTLTVPTAADIIAAFPHMDIGDSLVFTITNTAAQVATLTTATGVTLAGFSTANAQTRTCILVKTSSTTVTITAI